MYPGSLLMECLMRLAKCLQPLLFLCLAVTLTAGCSGPNLINITGKITVDGAPAVGAVLYFHPVDIEGASVASGVAESNGVFKLNSNLNAGVLPGKYVVTVSWPDPSVKPTEKQKMMGNAEPGPDLLKGRYIMKEKSGLNAEISSSTKELPTFELKTK